MQVDLPYALANSSQLGTNSQITLTRHRHTTPVSAIEESPVGVWTSP